MLKYSECHIRNVLKPGDLGYIVALHGIIYSQEYGFDHTFESYVAAPLAEFAASRSAKERIWIVESREQIVGSVAVVKHSDHVAQLRWLLVHPRMRGRGIGRRLVEEAVSFCRESEYSSVFLWTVDLLKEAAGLYKALGFKLIEEKSHRIWGVELTEQRYELVL